MFLLCFFYYLLRFDLAMALPLGKLLSCHQLWRFFSTPAAKAPTSPVAAALFGPQPKLQPPEIKCPPDAKLKADQARAEAAAATAAPKKSEVPPVPVDLDELYRETPHECKVKRAAVLPRADDLYPIVKNHQRPYRQQFCDVQKPPLALPKFENLKCCVDFGPRRPRKTPVARRENGACSVDTKEVSCQNGGGEGHTADTCKRIMCAGCAPARPLVMFRCEEYRPLDRCRRAEAPMPSFHEMYRKAIGVPGDQCTCHADKQPPCEPTERPRRLQQADR